MSRYHDTEFKKVCAWCKRTIKDGPEDGPTSHGICPECAEQVGAEDRAGAKKDFDCARGYRNERP